MPPCKSPRLAAAPSVPGARSHCGVGSTSRMLTLPLGSATRGPAEAGGRGGGCSAEEAAAGAGSSPHRPRACRLFSAAGAPRASRARAPSPARVRRPRGPVRAPSPRLRADATPRARMRPCERPQEPSCSERRGWARRTEKAAAAAAASNRSGLREQTRSALGRFFCLFHFRNIG